MDITQMIQSLGFPIASVMALGWFTYKMINRIQDEAKSREEKLLSVIQSFDSNLVKFNETLIKIDMRLSHVETRLEEKMEEK